MSVAIFIALQIISIGVIYYYIQILKTYDMNAYHHGNGMMNGIMNGAGGNVQSSYSYQAFNE